MPATNQLSPYCLAVTIYSPTFPSKILVWSQEVGMLPNNSVNFGSCEACDGFPENICIGLSYTTNMASWWQRVPWLITMPSIGRKPFCVALFKIPGSYSNDPASILVYGSVTSCPGV